MPSLRSILLLGLPLVSLALPNERQAEESEFDASTVAEWEEILKELPGESLKAALEGNLHPKYREGVFEHGHDAIDAVHNDDPELASKLVDLAKQDAEVKEYLKKRQSNNSTSSESVVTSTTPIIVTDSTTTAVTFTTETTTPSPTTPTVQSTPPTSSEATSVQVPTTDSQGRTTSTEVPVSSTREASQPITEPTVSDTETTQTGVLVPIQVTSTRDGTTVVQTTNALQTGDAPTSVMVDVTTTNDQGQTITTSSMAPAAIITSTNDQGDAVTTASPLSNVAVAPGGSVVQSDAGMVTTTDSQGDQVVLTSPTPGGVYTVTDVRGQVATITYLVGNGVVSQLRLQTTTLPNGQRSTITSFAEVGAQTEGVTPPPSGGPSSTPTASLQSGAGVLQTSYAAELALVLGAAIGVAAMML